MSVTKSLHEKVFDKFSDRLKTDLGEFIEKIVLFGSVVRDRERKHSDIDVLVVIEGDKLELKEKIIEIAYDLTLETGIYVPPKVLKKEEYERLKSAGSKFIESVDKEGKVIYD